MPIVKINMQKGFSPKYKKTVLDCVHSGLMEAIGIEDWDRFQRILEYEPENFEKPEGKTDHFMIIEITLFPGRTTEQKKRIIEIVTSKLVGALSIEPSDIFILLSDPPLENWGMAGKQK